MFPSYPLPVPVPVGVLVTDLPAWLSVQQAASYCGVDYCGVEPCRDVPQHAQKRKPMGLRQCGSRPLIARRLEPLSSAVVLPHRRTAASAATIHQKYAPIKPTNS